MKIRVYIRKYDEIYNMFIEYPIFIFRTGGSVPILKLIGLNLQPSNTSIPVKSNIYIQSDVCITMQLGGKGLFSSPADEPTGLLVGRYHAATINALLFGGSIQRSANHQKVHSSYAWFWSNT